MYPRLKPLAAILTALFAIPVQAQQLALLDPVLVTATRTETRIDSSLSDVTVVTREEIQASPQTSLVEVLGTLPGIQFSSKGGHGSSGSLFLRGSNSEHSLILVDGQRISSATLGTTAIEHIPLELVERIEIVRGPASGLYGADAIGGVIQIFTRRGEGSPKPSFFLGYGRYNTTTLSAGYGGRIGDTAFSIQAGQDSSSAYSTFRNPVGGFFDPYNADNDAYRNTNLSAQISHKLSNKLEVGAQIFHVKALKHFDATNCDVDYIVCTSSYDNRLIQELDSYAGYLRVKPTDYWSSQLKAGQSRDKLRNWRLEPLIAQDAVDQYVTTQNQVSWQNDFSLGQFGKLVAAYDWRSEEVDSTQTFATHSRSNNALTIGYQGWHGPHSLQTSFRRDAISGFDPKNSYSLGYGYEILSGLRARGSLGRAFHVPTFNQLYWPADPVNFFKGNPNLQVEESYNREIGLVYDKAQTQTSLTLYKNKVSNLLNYVAANTFPFLSQYENLGKASLKGASFNFAHSMGAWKLSTGFDYLNAHDEVSGKVLQARVPRSGNIAINYTQGQWESGVQILAYSGHYNDSSNQQWLAGYALTNLVATYRMNDGWSVQLRADNVFDRKYVAVRDPYNGNDYTTPGASLFVGIRYAPK